MNYLLQSVITFSFLSINTVSSAVEPPDLKCETEGYVVERQAYMLGMDVSNQVGFDGIPLWFPIYAQKFLSKAQTLPIDSSHDQINGLFEESPEYSIFTRTSERYTWTDGKKYKFKIRKYQGCLKEISIFLNEVPGFFDGKSVYIYQKNLTGDTSGYINPPKANDCPYKSIESDWTYLVDGGVKKSYGGRLPASISTLDKTLRGLNRNRHQVFDGLGQPETVDGSFVWEVDTDDVRSTTAIAEFSGNCVSERTISWHDIEGRHHKLVGKFEYSNVQNSTWYVFWPN